MNSQDSPQSILVGFSAPMGGSATPGGNALRTQRSLLAELLAAAYASGEALDEEYEEEEDELPPLLARPSSAGQLGAAATLVRLCRSATTRASAPCCTRRAWRLSEQTRSKVPHSRLQSPFRTQRTSSTKPKLRSVPASSTPGSTFGRSLSIGSSSGSRLCNSNRSRCSNDERRRIQTTRRVFALQPCFRRCGAHLQTQEDFLLSWRTCSRDLRKRPFRRLGF